MSHGAVRVLASMSVVKLKGDASPEVSVPVPFSAEVPGRSQFSVPAVTLVKFVVLIAILRNATASLNASDVAQVVWISVLFGAVVRYEAVSYPPANSSFYR
jgi:hypothetical protein